MTYNYPHPCGLDVTNDDDAFALVSPRVITFTTQAGYEGFGDIDIDGVDFGWYPEAAAHDAADYFGNAELRIATPAAAYKPRNPRRS